MLTDIPDWIISDTHWNHANISKYSARCTPAHPTSAHIDELMRFNWHGLVKPTDTVLHLGDIGFFRSDEEAAFLKDLPGVKYIVRGNHDKKMSAQWFADHDFTEIDAPAFAFEDFEIICTHYPQRSLRAKQVNICGHVHNNPWTATPRHINASVELWHYAPVSGRFLAEKVVWSSRTNADDSGPRNVRRSKRLKTSVTD